MAKQGGGKLVYATIDGTDLLRQMQRLPKEVNQELRRRNKPDSEKLADALRASPARTPQQELVQKAIYTKMDRTIRVDVGGKKRVGRRYQRRNAGGRNWRSPAGLLVYGTEYGSSGEAKDKSGRDMGRRFRFGNTKKGYWIAPTTEKYVPQLKENWERRMQYLLRRRGF